MPQLKAGNYGQSEYFADHEDLQGVTAMLVDDAPLRIQGVDLQTGSKSTEYDGDEEYGTSSEKLIRVGSYQSPLAYRSTHRD